MIVLRIFLDQVPDSLHFFSWCLNSLAYSLLHWKECRRTQNQAQAQELDVLLWMKTSGDYMLLL